MQYFTDVYDSLIAQYGKQNWWPAESLFEVMVGAILVQNTQWFNVKKAIKNLKDERVLEPRKMALCTEERLATLIVHAGYYNVKAKRLKNFLNFLTINRFDFYALKIKSTEELRNQLLSINGIGPETADSIMLYALDHRTFVVDAYTRRLFSRLKGEFAWMTQVTYDELKLFFEKQIPNDLYFYNEFHALIDIHSKDICKSRPLCEDCVLRGSCAYNQLRNAH
jgi:endonuclease-3 related protein